MNYLSVMLKKEWLENIKTHRSAAMFICGIFFGILGPFTALIMPDLMAKLLPKNLRPIIPEPTYIDSYTQYFKNINQLGLVILVFLFSSTLTQELAKGTLINLITKGLSKTSVIIAKFGVLSFIWSFTYLAGSAVHYGYTLYYFNNKGLHKITAYLGSWLFGLLLISLILLFSSLFKKNSAVLLGIFTAIVAFFLINFMRPIKDFSPLLLIQKQSDLLLGHFSLHRYQLLLLLVVALILMNLAAANLTFKRSEM